jgi:hypothetical protein
MRFQIREQFPWLALLVFSACTSSSGQEEKEPEDGSAEARGVWEFLSDEYDADLDGKVTRAEYEHEGAELRSLDSDGNGYLSAEDFSDAEIHSSFDRSRRSQFSLLEYFQDDEQPLNLTREECARSAAFYDADQDGKISKLEFRAHSQARHRNLLAPDWLVEPEAAEPRYPWAELRLSIDTDRDRALSLAELDRFFMDNASGREVWNAERYMGFPLKPGFESLSGPRLGDEAPDFSLERSDGKGSIRLSSFKGERPVALIFGSYT